MRQAMIRSFQFKMIKEDLFYSEGSCWRVCATTKNIKKDTSSLFVIICEQNRMYFKRYLISHNWNYFN